MGEGRKNSDKNSEDKSIKLRLQYLSFNALPDFFISSDEIL